MHSDAAQVGPSDGPVADLAARELRRQLGPELAPGLYAVATPIGNLGDITIKGNVYSGPVTFGSAQPAYNYQMDANGVISWLGPLGGYTTAGNSISLTQATLDGETTPSFDIIMKQPDGAFTASTCTKN